ncbi:hypothetical protein [uncultured Kordia sp.]|uniref:hypothetical protein n=1 Tax=uncultured Kordia sp. TaxID=507699 RepID=UPI0026275D6B|nr:hypothetical protein [uncultured Kordia sp.]
MKYLLCLFSITLFAKGCNNSETETIKSAQDDISISYEASSRGFYQKVNLTKEKFSFTKIRDGKVSVQQEMSTEDWNEIIQLLDKIDSEKVKSNPAKEEDLARDAAIPATLAIKYKDNTVTTSSFGHGNPPETLAPLMNKIQAMIKAVDKP